MKWNLVPLLLVGVFIGIGIAWMYSACSAIYDFIRRMSLPTDGYHVRSHSGAVYWFPKHHPPFPGWRFIRPAEPPVNPLTGPATGPTMITRGKW